jgi:hypothetical protein
MSRIGKIARLSEPIREQINHRLQDGENGRKIIPWLNAIDEVKTVLAQEFEGNEITDSNLSHWKLGGYRDWEGQQITLNEARRVISEGGELAKTGDGALADKLAVWLVGRYVVVTRQLLKNGNSPKAWKLLRELCHDLVSLRRGDHGAEWLRIDREKLELQRRREAREETAAKSEATAETKPAAPVLSDEEKERKWRQVFGMQPL